MFGLLRAARKSKKTTPKNKKHRFRGNIFSFTKSHIYRLLIAFIFTLFLLDSFVFFNFTSVRCFGLNFSLCFSFLVFASFLYVAAFSMVLALCRTRRDFFWDYNDSFLQSGRLSTSFYLFERSTHSALLHSIGSDFLNQMTIIAHLWQSSFLFQSSC